MSIMLRKARRNTHVEVLVQWGLKVCLTYIGRCEVVVTGRSESENKTESRDFSDGGEHPVKVHAPFLGITVGNQTALKLLNAAVTLALNCEYHMASHNVSRAGDIIQARELEGAKIKEATKFLIDGIAPIGGFRGGESLSIRARNMDVAEVQGRGDKICTLEAGDVGLTKREVM